MFRSISVPLSYPHLAAVAMTALYDFKIGCVMSLTWSSFPIASAVGFFQSSVQIFFLYFTYIHPSEEYHCNSSRDSSKLCITSGDTDIVTLVLIQAQGVFPLVCGLVFFFFNFFHQLYSLQYANLLPP